MHVVSASCNEIWKEGGGGREGRREGGGDRKRPGDVCMYVYIYIERERAVAFVESHAHA